MELVQGSASKVGMSAVIMTQVIGTHICQIAATITRDQNLAAQFTAAFKQDHPLAGFSSNKMVAGSMGTGYQLDPPDALRVVITRNPADLDNTFTVNPGTARYSAAPQVTSNPRRHRAGAGAALQPSRDTEHDDGGQRIRG